MGLKDEEAAMRMRTNGIKYIQRIVRTWPEVSDYDDICNK